jgi:DNA-nicking Smr family endonuclease
VARGPRQLTPAEHAVWTSFTRLVSPLPGHTAGAGATGETEGQATDTPAIGQALPASRPQPGRTHETLSVGRSPGGLDAASWNRLRTGKLVPARTLDLHGRTVQRAFVALSGFLHAAHADGVRCVEVITGKGRGEATGAIRRELPLWLNLPALRPIVLAASYPHPANEGAVRILLRRARG